MEEDLPHCSGAGFTPNNILARKQLRVAASQGPRQPLLKALAMGALPVYNDDLDSSRRDLESRVKLLKAAASDSPARLEERAKLELE